MDRAEDVDTMVAIFKETYIKDSNISASCWRNTRLIAKPSHLCLIYGFFFQTLRLPMLRNSCHRTRSGSQRTREKGEIQMEIETVTELGPDDGDADANFDQSHLGFAVHAEPPTEE